MIALTPNRRAAWATDWPWLPVDADITPRRRSSSVRRLTRLMPPRTLKAADIDNANATLQKKYPGGKVTVVTEGDETGALITVPFKTEKDAFAFMTQPSTLNPSKATSGSGVGLNLSNTGGLFTSAKHTTSGSSDTYT